MKRYNVSLKQIPCKLQRKVQSSYFNDINVCREFEDSNAVQKVNKILKELNILLEKKIRKQGSAFKRAWKIKACNELLCHNKEIAKQYWLCKL